MLKRFDSSLGEQAPPSLEASKREVVKAAHSVVYIGDMEEGSVSLEKGLIPRVWDSYKPTVQDLTSRWLKKMEDIGGYVCDTIGITRPQYEYEISNYFEQEQGTSCFI
eukprot:NODE_480_length_6952_cov_0.771487.p6 type:complete len:108 gc:universal NODE_480_length_6952_cov_0.771487:2752-3075(+)